MTATPLARLEYGPRKYAALHLLLCRWMRLYARNDDYYYVTLGGTELKDIESLRFVDAKLISSVRSYETKPRRYELAQARAAELVGSGVELELHCATLFSHQRVSTRPHIFFLDLEGICAWSDYDHQFGNLFQNEIIREGDCLLITSHLGHRPGLGRIREHFSGEFSVLGIDEDNDEVVRNLYRRAHPTMTLFKGLALNGIQTELSIRCFGGVKYRDGSPMGLYGYAVASGSTDLAGLVGDSETNYFDVNEGRLCLADAF